MLTEKKKEFIQFMLSAAVLRFGVPHRGPAIKARGILRRNGG